MGIADRKLKRKAKAKHGIDKLTPADVRELVSDVNAMPCDVGRLMAKNRLRRLVLEHIAELTCFDTPNCAREVLRLLNDE